MIIHEESSINIPGKTAAGHGVKDCFLRNGLRFDLHYEPALIF